MTGPTQTSPPSRSTEKRDADLPAGGARIGPYRMLCRIGEGGMGAVRLAEREDQFHRQVTVKLSKFSPESGAGSAAPDAPAGQPTPWARRLLEAKLTRFQKAAKGVGR